MIGSIGMSDFTVNLFRHIKETEHFKTYLCEKIQQLENKMENKPQIFFVFSNERYYFFGSDTFNKKHVFKQYGGEWGAFLRNKTQIVKAWCITHNVGRFMKDLSSVEFVYEPNTKIIDVDQSDYEQTKMHRLNKF